MKGGRRSTRTTINQSQQSDNYDINKNNKNKLRFFIELYILKDLKKNDLVESK